MREPGEKRAQARKAEPQAYAFDGWSFVPLEAPRPQAPKAETPAREAALVHA